MEPSQQYKTLSTVNRNMFKEEATYEGCIILEENTELGSAYISKCVGDVTVYNRVTVRASEKP